IHAATQPSYQPVTGQAAEYTRTSKQITVHLKGGPHKYWMFPQGMSPDRPDTLPSGTRASIMVRDEGIGKFDALTPTQHWHVVTRGFAEPWTVWANDALWEFGLLYFLAGIAVTLGRHSWGRRRLREHPASTGWG
ncbi:MAG TPA: hypothetical protein VGP82_16510, partial [Ktedonobacterales bacterium]|nr:hypothetical protein [Ktedonobacterales bacterium]